MFGMKHRFSATIIVLAIIMTIQISGLVAEAGAIPTDYHEGQVVILDPSNPLQDTGIDLVAGAAYYIRYHGWWSSAGVNYPERSGDYHDLRGRLWGRIGGDDDFKLGGGSEREAFVADISGRLYLFVQDNDHSDNLGSGVAIVYTLTEPTIVSISPDNPEEHPEQIPVASFDVSVHPNPFNPMTSISFSLERPGRVQVGVYSLSGQRLVTLADRVFGAGLHALTWDGQNRAGRPAATGMYCVRIENEGGYQTKKMTLVR